MLHAWDIYTEFAFEKEIFYVSVMTLIPDGSFYFK